MRGMAAVLVLVLVLSFAGGLVLLDFGGVGDRARADRLAAAAELERARAAADVERLAAERLTAEQAHRHAMESVPVVVAVAGGVFLVALVVFLFWDGRDRRRSELAARAALPPVRVVVLPVVMSSGDSRGELWRSVSASVDRALVVHPGDDFGIRPGGGDGGS